MRRLTLSSIALTIAAIASCASDASGAFLNGPNGMICLLDYRIGSLSLNNYNAMVDNHDLLVSSGVGIKVVSGNSMQDILRRVFSVDSDCDMFVGPGSSGRSMAINPALPVLHLEFAAGAMDLANKANFPYFGRINPSAQDQGFGMADTAHHFGITSFNVLSAQDPFAASITASVGIRAAQNNQTIDELLFMSESAPEELPSLVRRLERSDNRFLFISTSPTSALFQTTLALMAESGYLENHEIVTSSGFCANALPQNIINAFNGAMCVSVFVDQAGLDALEARGRLDGPVQQAALAEMARVGSVTVDRSLSATFNAYAADAVRFAVQVLLEARRRNVSTNDLSNMYDILAATRLTDGLSGEVGVDPTTNSRLNPRMFIVNLYQGGQVRVGQSVSGQLTMTQQPHWTDNTTNIPTTFLPKSASTSSDDNTVTIVVVVVVAVVVLVVVALLAVMKGAGGGRDNSAAPKDASKPVTVVFTDIQSSTDLWGAVPELMPDVIDLHHSIQRQMIAKHSGYEVKTIGDAFMVAFAKPDDALAYVLELQSALHSASWPSEIEEIYKELQMQHVDETVRSLPAQRMGLRVRVALHTGACEIKQDPTTGGYDYYGTVVNVAARLEGLAFGGQVVGSDDFVKALSSEAINRTGCVIGDLGNHALKGVYGEVHANQLLPGPLSDRVFPKLSADNAELIDNPIGHDGFSDTSSQSTVRTDGGGALGDDHGQTTVRLLFSLCAKNDAIVAAKKAIAASWRTSGETPDAAFNKAVMRASRAADKKVRQRRQSDARHESFVSRHSSDNASHHAEHPHAVTKDA